MATLKVTSSFYCVLIAMLLHLRVSRTDDQLNFNLSTILKDPRRNSSFYDFFVNQSSVNNTGNIFVGNVADVIRQKGY